MLSEKEKRYSYLSYVAKWEPLPNKELKECENIQKELNLIPCDQCKGEGHFYSPSILGYGYEEGACTKCNGLGELGHSEELKKELLNERIEL
jgi:DnaJ-class molecular chaperone